MTWVTLYETITSPVITVESTTFKFLLSLIAGGLVGLNRERHKQTGRFSHAHFNLSWSYAPYGASIYIPQTYFDFKNGDPGRIAAQVVTGIGFLGAGAIIRFGNNVRGLTTAASIWLISAVGLSIGAGLYIISMIMVVFALFTLYVLNHAERKLIPQLNVKTITLEFDSHTYPEVQIEAIMSKMRIHVSDFNVSVCSNGSNHTEFSMVVKIPEEIKLSELLNLFHSLDNIKSVKLPSSLILANYLLFLPSQLSMCQYANFQFANELIALHHFIS